MKNRLDKMRWLALVLVAIAAVFNYRGMAYHMMAVFANPIEDMSHGWLVPFVSLTVLWWRRQALRKAACEPNGIGAGWVMLFLVIAWLGGRGGQSRIEQVSLIGLVWALPYAFWGRRVERLMRFPAAYLLFAVPVSSYIDFFTMHLRLFSTVMATGLLNGIGLSVERMGTALFSRMPGAEFNVDVADPCSGIRSLFAMMALTAAYAFFTQKVMWKKWALFACSLPIAMIGNMVRIMSICLVATWFGQKVATGYYHDYSGFVIFVVGVCLMFQTGEWIKKIKVEGENDELGVEDKEMRDSGPKTEGQRVGVALVCGVCVLVLTVFATKLSMSPPVYDSVAFIAETLPERVGEFESDMPWFCHDPQCLKTAEGRELKKGMTDGVTRYVCPACGKMMHSVSLGEFTDLPQDTMIIKRNYRAPDGLMYVVSVVIGGRQRDSIHRAELCLPAQGFAMLGAERLSLRLANDKAVVVRKINAQRSGGTAMSLVYWFLSRERECCSHAQRILTDVWDRSIHNRINRWVMIAVNVSSPLESPESIKRFEAFLSELVPQIILER